MSFQRFNMLRRFRKNENGATAVEFAILSVPLITVIFAALQTSIIFFFDQALQTATQKAARQLMTGSAQTANMTQSQFQSAVCGYLPSQFNCSNVMVDVESSTTFSNVNTTMPTVTYGPTGNVTNTWQYSPGGSGSIVIIRAMYDWPVLGGQLAVGLATQPDGGHLMVATAVFKNEPYQ